MITVMPSGLASGTMEYRWLMSYRNRVTSWGYEPIEGQMSLEDIERIQGTGDKCYLCQSRRATQIDHVIPVSIGGPHALTFCRRACAGCNSAKGNRFDHETLFNAGLSLDAATRQLKNLGAPDMWTYFDRADDSGGWI